jgi:biofilm PGA synthesis N-glycosyltransferase PgaC
VDRRHPWQRASDKCWGAPCLLELHGAEAGRLELSPTFRLVSPMSEDRSESGLTYSLVTSARDEAENLPRLAACVARQIRRPQEWIIVDNGSVDSTVEIAAGLADEHEWIRLLFVPPDPAQHGAHESRAFASGVDALAVEPGVVVKLDADVSFEDDYFDRLLASFESNPSLGIASGICLEEGPQGWQATYSTRSHARGATRAYRWACWQIVSPLEQRLSWDTVDELKARAAGWTVVTIAALPFRHHRKASTRDGIWRASVRLGIEAHYLAYRPSYFVARSLYRSLQNPAATGLLWGYVSAAARRRSRLPDEAVRRMLREEQRLRHLRTRVLESRGRLFGVQPLL